MNKHNPSSGVSGSIPMRKPLQQFLQVRERLQVDEPLVIPGKSPIKIFLDSLLTNKTAIREDKRNCISNDCYNVKQKFLITEGVAEWGELFFTPSRIIRFNSFVRQIMLESLVFQTISDHKRGIDEKQTIYQFIEDYKLYSINFDSLKKATFRYRKMQGIENFSTRKRQTFPQASSSR